MKLAAAFSLLRRAVGRTRQYWPWMAIAVVALWLGVAFAPASARRPASEHAALRAVSSEAVANRRIPGILAGQQHSAPLPTYANLPPMPKCLRSSGGSASSGGYQIPAALANMVQRCQALGPAAPCPIMGIDCWENGPCGAYCRDCRWRAMGPVDWQAYAQGEYVGHWRTPHVPLYQLRVDDQLECVYRLTRDVQPNPYRLNVGDEVQVESFTDPNLNRNLIIQPDGTITLRLLGEVRAAGLTVQELRGKLDESYSKYYKLPSITVTPLKVNTQLDDLRAAVDNRAGIGGQGRPARVTPQGTIDLPGLNNIPAQGLTLDELKQEIIFRYQRELGIEGIEVTPILTTRAPRYIYVFGEVNTPGRFVMEGPTTLMQAISLAGSWKVGANLRHIVIFRRGDDWRLLATRVNMQSTMLFNRQPCPAGEIWLDDSDIVMVPKAPILIIDDFINLYFTRGAYSVLPFSTFYSFNNAAIVE